MSKVWHTGSMNGQDQPYPNLDGLEVEDAKEALRTQIRDTRKTRSQAKRDQAGIDLADALEKFPQYTAATCVSVYVSRPTEPSTAEILSRLRARGVRILLPVLGDGLQRGWAQDHGTDDLIQRAPGRPPEPSGPFLSGETLAEAEFIIVPALAVDTAGHRLGQGGGWYDRALSFANPQAMVVALAFPEEVYDAQASPIPVEAHDHAIDAIVTPEGITRLEEPVQWL